MIKKKLKKKPRIKKNKIVFLIAFIKAASQLLIQAKATSNSTSSLATPQEITATSKTSLLSKRKKKSYSRKNQPRLYKKNRIHQRCPYNQLTKS